MGIKIDTLPPALRAQVEAKLRAEDKRRLASSNQRGGREMIGWGLKFCAHCDYAISRIEMDSYRGDLDKTMCPRCGMCRLSMFYSYGSQCHINRREAWERGEAIGAPLPVPNAQAHFSEVSDSERGIK